MGLSVTPACPPPPTNLTVVSTTGSSLEGSGSGGGCVASDVSGDGSMGSFSTPGTESANKSWRAGESGVKVVGEVVVGVIDGGGIDKMGMAEPAASKLSWRSGDITLPVFRVDVTRPTSSAGSRIVSIRPDSRSNEECLEVGGDGEGTMSEAVGSITGRGAGTLVTEIVGKLEGDDGGFDIPGFEWECLFSMECWLTTPTVGEGMVSIESFKIGIGISEPGPCGEISLMSKLNCSSG